MMSCKSRRCFLPAGFLGTTPVDLMVAGYKAPRYIEWVEEIPRNISGKILKIVLTERPTDQSQRVSRNGA